MSNLLSVKGILKPTSDLSRSSAPGVQQTFAQGHEERASPSPRRGTSTA